MVRKKCREQDLCILLMDAGRKWSAAAALEGKHLNIPEAAN